MSFPASLTTRTVTGRFVTYPDGAGAKGSVIISLSTYMQGPTDNAFIAPFALEIKLNPQGSFSVVLPATNDPQWTEVRYKVRLEVNGKKQGPYDLHVPYDGTDPIDLADVLNIPTPTIGESYILASAKGAPGGVAVLGSDGIIVSSQLPQALNGVVYWDDVENKPDTFPSDPVSWTDVQNKPTTFPHDEVTYAEVTGKPSSFTPSAHNHPFSEITSKPSTYPPDAHTHAFSEVTDKPATYPPSTHSHAFDDVTGKPTSYPPASHSHATSEVVGLDSTLAGKSNTNHTHATSDVSGLDSALAGKSSTGHTHATSDVSGLDTALAGKSNTNHTHAFSDITGKPSTYPHDTISWDEIAGKPSTFPSDGLTAAQVSALDADRLNLVTTGEELIPRGMVGSTVALDLAVLHLTFFTARKTESITKMLTATGATAFSGTRSQVAIYSVSTDGTTLTLVTTTADSGTLWSSAYTEYNTPLLSTFNKVAGSRYAVGFLAVGTTAPTLPFQVISYFADRAPRIVGWYSTNSAPSSLAVSSLNTDWRRIQGILLPT